MALSYLYRNLILLSILFASCEKQEIKTIDQKSKDYTLSVYSDNKNDIITVTKNGNKIGAQCNIVTIGDTISIFHEPEKDSLENYKKTSIIAVYNGGEILLFKESCYCITNKTFIVK